MSDATVVTLEYWYHAVWGDRWTLHSGGTPALTYGTEAEARAAAERHGWTIDEAGERGGMG